MKKYEKVTKTDYEKWYLENGEYRRRVSQDGSRLRFHLMPETGWLNDPNGLCRIGDTYHVFYQYGPFDATGGVKHWGHVTSRDLMHWEHQPVMLYPDEPFD